MKNPLISYLHDHLAGASYAIDLIESLRDHYNQEPLGQFAAQLHREITEDRDTLTAMAQRFGTGSSSLKDGAAWLSEKASKVKLQHSDPSGLGTFEALEFLQIGIYGKLALWRALSAISGGEVRLTGFDFDDLQSRAQKQIASVEQHRLAEALKIFASETQVNPSSV
ncbi:MAG: hypothetical protein WBR26_24895 [Candidatus Acidiferrum sp.]